MSGQLTASGFGLHRTATAAALALGVGLGIACAVESVNVLDHPGRDGGLGDAGGADRDAGRALDAVAESDAGSEARVDSGCVAGKIGQMCQGSEECCSGFCSAGTCQPATGCLGVGKACSYAGQCCSVGCDAEEGGAPPRACGDALCGVLRSPCSSSTDCCENLCVDGGCAEPMPGPPCKPAGELCKGPGDCCGRDCATAADGLERCALLQGCRVIGETCSGGSDCCSGLCSSVGEALGKCSSPMMMCTSNDKGMCTDQVGDICGSNNDCCSRTCVKTGDGTSLCAPAGGCTPQCGLCSSGDECCSGSCMAGPDGVKVCHPSGPGPGMCGHDGEICGGNGDCCPGSLCEEEPPMVGAKRCVPEVDAGCRTEGRTCALPEECCGGFCVPGKAGSLACGSCVRDGDGCTSPSDCCETGSDCLSLDGALSCAPVSH